MRENQPLNETEITEELDRRIKEMDDAILDCVTPLRSLRDWITEVNAERKEFRETFDFGGLILHPGGVYDVIYAQWGGRVITLRHYTFQGRAGYNWDRLRFSKRPGVPREVPIDHIKAIMPGGHAL